MTITNKEINTKENPYEGFTARRMKKIIAAAVKEFRLSGWDAPKGFDEAEHVQHIDNMCNEFGLVPNTDGDLIQH